MRVAGRLLTLLLLVGCSGPPASAPHPVALGATAGSEQAPAPPAAPTFVLHTTGRGMTEGIPVFVDGELVARTDRSGVARWVSDAAPGDTVEVRLATSLRANDILPIDPTTSVVVRASETVMHFALSLHPASVRTSAGDFCGLGRVAGRR